MFNKSLRGTNTFIPGRLFTSGKMAEVQDDDPFDWEIDRVVQELCSSNRSWKPAQRAQFPEPGQLAAKLRDAGYDGQVLLISLDDEADLWSDLSISATKFKQSIRTAIRQFRSRSHKFKEYEQSLREDIPGPSESPNPSGSSTALIETSNKRSANEYVQGLVYLENGNGTRNLRDRSDADEPPKKKPRRLDAWGLVAVQRPANSAILRTIPTEADTVTLPTRGQTSARSDKAGDGNPKLSSSLEKLRCKPGAYWGEGTLSSTDILEFHDSATNDSPEFQWSQPVPLGNARKVFVNGHIKRYFRRSLQPTTIDDTENGDQLLPLYGDSAADYFDPDQDAIDREIEEEEEEVRREKEMLRKSDLSSEAVDACLTQMCDEYTTYWRETKLPGLRRKAYGIWTKARKNGTRNSRVLELSNTLSTLSNRLDAVLNGLKENVYSKETELRRMGPVLEPPIYEIEKAKWSIGVLLSQTAPERFCPQKSAKDTVPKKATLEQQDHGFDIWSDEETDGLDEFVIDDSSTFGEANESSVDADQVVINRITDVSKRTLHGSLVGQSFTSTSDDVMVHDLTGPDDALVELPTPVELGRTSDQPGDQIRLSDLDDIVNKGTEHWEHLGDCPRLVLTIIHNLSETRKERIFRPINNSDNSEQVWQETIEPVLLLQPNSPASTLREGDPKNKVRRETAVRLAKLFDIYTGSKTISDKSKKLDQETVTRVRHQHNEFDSFWNFLRMIAPWCLEKLEEAENETDLSNANDTNLTPSQRKKRSQANARRIQRHDIQDSQAQQARRELLRQRLQDSVQVSKEEKRLIINESKMEDEGFVFIHDQIAPRIRDHQIDGVRFMWDQVTRSTGCLLAHTMGLGKTMQVITLLTAIADATKSGKENIVKQIPKHLRDLKILILCPSGVVNNWVDELLLWAPEGILGEIWTFASTLSNRQRQDTVQKWATAGGVLVMGYSLLSKLGEEHYGTLLDLLLESPSLVVGDEAHQLKNSSSNRGRIAAQFKTKSRIALTGSPLSNNVKEYFSMIDWVSPGFLGKREDFASKYAIPIKEGLWASSHAQDRRRARIALAALKKVVAPKVHRRAVAVLKESLPPKKEFILNLDLLPFQKKAYQTYIECIRNTGCQITQTTVFGMKSTLRGLIAHPAVLHNKLQKQQKERGQFQSKKQGNDDDIEEPANVFSTMCELLGSERRFETICASYKMLVLDKIMEQTMKRGENILIFSHSLLVLDYVQANLCHLKQRACKRLDGNTATTERQAMVKEFNNNKAQAFLISTTAGGVGLNIYGANRVVILDFEWNPANEQQAIGRAYRIGQTKPVTVYWLICNGTFEQTLHTNQVFKTQLASRVVDSKHPLPKADRELGKWFNDCQEMPHQDLSGYRGKDVILDSLLDTETICSGISSINTTETFEEEESDTALNANDQIEADRMAAEQNLPGNITMVAGVAQKVSTGQIHLNQDWQVPFANHSAAVNRASAPGHVWPQLPGFQPSHSVASGSSGHAATPPSHPFALRTEHQVQYEARQPRPYFWSASGAPLSSPNSQAVDGANATTPNHALSGTSLGQQQPQQQQPPFTPLVPLGASNLDGEERATDESARVDAPQPIMVNAQQRTTTPKPLGKMEQNKNDLKRKLIQLCPTEASKVDQVLQDIDKFVGELPRMKFFSDLLAIISEHPTLARAIANGRISTHALTKASSTTKDKLKEMLLMQSRERDPDV